MDKPQEGGGPAVSRNIKIGIHNDLEAAQAAVFLTDNLSLMGNTQPL